MRNNEARMRTKDIVGFEGLYAITDHGDVIRLYRAWRDKQDRLTMRPTRTLVVPVDARGYRTVRLFAPDGRYRRDKVHRLVAEAFLEQHNGGTIVNHIDGDPSNNHYTNLEWCDQSANFKHGYLRRIRTPLTATEIMEIKRLHGTVPLETLANRYNADKATIQRVVWGYKRKPR